MKHRIDINGFLIDSYSSEYPYFNESWLFTEVELPEGLIKPKFDSVNWIEGATESEINDSEFVVTREYVKKFMENKRRDGCEYYNEMDLTITMALSAVDREVLFPILAEIDDLVYPPLTKMKTGDFASALYLFTNQPVPELPFVLNFYNQALAFCQNYYDTKYPK